jgi:putative endonuclease
MASHSFHYVYILESLRKKDALYIGLTEDLKRRFHAHNSGNVISTRSLRPWKLLSAHAFPNRDTARSFETYLKTASGKAFLRKRLR